MEQKQAELVQREEANIRDNETKVMIAHISASNKYEDGINIDEYSEKIKQLFRKK